MSEQNRRSAKEIPEIVGKAILRFFTHNWQYKLLALLIAVILWAGLISQDNNLTREKVFNDVTVTVNGADYAIQNNGLIVVSGLDSEALTARMWVDVPQGQYMTVTAASYNPRIDLTRITEPGEQNVKIITTSSAANGSVKQIIPESVPIVVDEYVTNYRIPVSVNIIGEYPKGMGGTTPVTDPSTVAVSGPRTLVDQVSRLCVDYDLSLLKDRKGSLRTALLYRFEDNNGNVIDSDLLSVSGAGVVLRTITVTQTVYAVKEVPVSVLNATYGTPCKGYEITDIRFSPESITIGGSDDALMSVNEIFPDEPVNVEGEYETITDTVKIHKPSDITYFSTDTVMVTVTIEPTVLVKEFSDVRLNTTGLFSNLKVKNLPKNVTVRLKGTMNELSGLKSGNISAYIDLSGVTEAGVYTLPVSVQINDENGYGFTVDNPMEMIVMVENK